MRRVLLIAPILATLAACSSRQALFVVLPNPGGGSGAITVNDGQQSVLLDQPYAAEEIKGGKGVAGRRKPGSGPADVSATRSPRSRFCPATSASTSKATRTF